MLHYSVLYEAGIVRQNNTTAYAANDIINDATTNPWDLSVEFPQEMINPRLENAWLFSDFAAATLGQFQVCLFKQPIVLAADNSQTAFTSSEMRSLIAVLNVASSIKSANGALYYIAPIEPVPLNIPWFIKHLYAAIVAINAYTPGAYEDLKLRVQIGYDLPF